MASGQRGARHSGKRAAGAEGGPKARSEPAHRKTGGGSGQPSGVGRARRHGERSDSAARAAGGHRSGSRTASGRSASRGAQDAVGKRIARPAVSAPARGTRAAAGNAAPRGHRHAGPRSGSPHEDHRAARARRREDEPAGSDVSRRREDSLPAVPEDADPSLLDRAVRAELRSLSKSNAETVAKHLVAAGQLLDTDPHRALGHANAARARAARVGAVREAVGVAAYRAGEWATALRELRAARRISGDPRTLPLIADAERALGRPQAAVRMLNEPDVAKLDSQTRIELLIVVAGARRDLGDVDAALSVLARGGLDRERPRPGSMRLWYAYGDALEAAGRSVEAAQWFAASAALDPTGDLDAAERAANLL